MELLGCYIGGAVKFTEFKKANPPPFWVTYNPDKAEEQIKVMDKIFCMLTYTEQQKVAFATYMQESGAEFWWASTKRLVEGAQTIITWYVFKGAFY